MVSLVHRSSSENSDNLLDVLASFNAPRSDLEAPRSADISGIPPPPLNAPTARPLQTASAPPPAEAEEDFEASLVEGMESLLRQLAGDHPPGPMPDIVPPPPASHPNGTTSAPLEKNGEGQMSAEEEEKAWQKAVEMMLSGQGLEALGLEKNGERSSTPPAPRNRDGGVKPDFQETIRRTMESLNQPVSSGSKGGGSGSTEEPGNATNLAALLGKFGSDPSALDGLGGDDDELGGLLDGMMTQLMTREVLEEPMAELASKASHLRSILSFPSTCCPDRQRPYRCPATSKLTGFTVSRIPRLPTNDRLTT